MKSLQHHQQDVKEVVSRERLEHLHGQQQSRPDYSASHQTIAVTFPTTDEEDSCGAGLMNRREEKRKTKGFLLAGENNQSSREEDHRKQNEQRIACLPPTSAVVEHLGRLEKFKMIFFLKKSSQ